MQVLAVDWSGARDADRGICAARISEGGLGRFTRGRAVVDELIAEAQVSDRLVVGFDFAFSLPGWFLATLGVADVRELWRRMEAEADDWLAPRDPFWKEAGRAPHRARRFRRTEDDVRAPGVQPKSVFQLVGAGVGAASLRGMPVLLRLAEEGFHVWPFDDFGWPLAVEIYPAALKRLLSDEERRDLDGRGLGEHCFDAAASALVMWRHRDRLARLRREPEYALEGRIWVP